MRTFKPSEDWEKDANEDNFMGGQDEDEDATYQLREHVGEEIINAANAISTQCEYVLGCINQGKEDWESYNNGSTSFVVDYDKCAYVIINPGTDIDMEITLKTYRGFAGAQYSIDVPEGGEGAKHCIGYGLLSYNINEKESKKLYIGLIRAILNSTLYKNDYEFNNYTDLIPDNPKVTAAMKNSYNALVKTYKTLIKLYAGNEIKTPANTPWETEFSRQMQRKAVNERKQRKSK